MRRGLGVSEDGDAGGWVVTGKEDGGSHEEYVKGRTYLNYPENDCKYSISQKTFCGRREARPLTKTKEDPKAHRDDSNEEQPADDRHDHAGSPLQPHHDNVGVDLVGMKP